MGTVLYLKKQFQLQNMRTMELILRQKLDSDRSKYLPPIKRGGYIDIYMTSSGWSNKHYSFFCYTKEMFSFLLVPYKQYISRVIQTNLVINL